MEKLPKYLIKEGPTTTTATKQTRKVNKNMKQENKENGLSSIGQ